MVTSLYLREEGRYSAISFVGYITQEVKWNGTPLNIILKDDTQTLRSSGSRLRYTEESKSDRAVAMAESDVLEDRPIANLAQGLQGAIPNLNISFANGNPKLKHKHQRPRSYIIERWFGINLSRWCRNQ